MLWQPWSLVCSEEPKCSLKACPVELVGAMGNNDELVRQRVQERLSRTHAGGGGALAYGRERWDGRPGSSASANNGTGSGRGGAGTPARLTHAQTREIIEREMTRYLRRGQRAAHRPASAASNERDAVDAELREQNRRLMEQLQQATVALAEAEAERQRVADAARAPGATPMGPAEAAMEEDWSEGGAGARAAGADAVAGLHARLEEMAARLDAEVEQRARLEGRLVELTDRPALPPPPATEPKRPRRSSEDALTQSREAIEAVEQVKVAREQLTVERTTRQHLEARMAELQATLEASTAARHEAEASLRQLSAELQEGREEAAERDSLRQQLQEAQTDLERERHNHQLRMQELEAAFKEAAHEQEVWLHDTELGAQYRLKEAQNAAEAKLREVEGLAKVQTMEIQAAAEAKLQEMKDAASAEVQELQRKAANKIREVEAACAELREENTAARAQMAELREMLAEKEGKAALAAKLELELDLEGTVAADLRMENAQLRAEVDRLQALEEEATRLSEYSTSLSNQLVEAKKAESRAEDLAAELEETKKTLKHSDSAADELQSEAVRLASRLEDSEANFLALETEAQERIDALESSYAKLKAEASASEAAVMRLAAQIDDLEASNADLQDALDAEVAAGKLMRGELAQYAHNADVQPMLSAEQNEIAQLRAMVGAHRQAVEAAEARSMELEARAEESTSEHVACLERALRTLLRKHAAVAIRARGGPPPAPTPAERLGLDLSDTAAVTFFCFKFWENMVSGAPIPPPEPASEDRDAQDEMLLSLSREVHDLALACAAGEPM